MSINLDEIRGLFPVLHQEVHGKPLVYFDNAATTQKPKAVINALREYYEKDNSNIHRGAHALADRATRYYEETREAVRDFVGAREAAEIIFTKGTTEGINLVAQTFGRKFIGNFLEIEMSKKVFDNLLIQAGYERLDSDNYAKLSAKYDLKIVGDRVIRIFGETLMDVEKQTYNYEIGAEMDLLKTLLNKYSYLLRIKRLFNGNSN